MPRVPDYSKTLDTSAVWRHGLIFSLIANVTWMIQPLFWPLLKPSSAFELLAHRVVWSALSCAIFVLLLRRYRAVAQLCRKPRIVALLGGAGACVATAWGVYIYAVTTGHVVEGSLGLFMLPLTIVLVGVVVLRERLRLAQWIAVGGALVAVGILTFDYGRLPWIAVTISGLMAVYALLKKRAGAPALDGFMVECLVIVGPALGFIGWLMLTGGASVGRISLSHTALVATSGVITTIPLVSHAAAINRLSLTAVGILQYLNPVGQFLLGVLLLHEKLSVTRWLGFGLIWVVLAVFTASSLHSHRGAASNLA